jgi:hypothetical protein
VKLTTRLTCHLVSRLRIVELLFKSPYIFMESCLIKRYQVQGRLQLWRTRALNAKVFRIMRKEKKKVGVCVTYAVMNCVCLMQ